MKKKTRILLTGSAAAVLLFLVIPLVTVAVVYRKTMFKPSPYGSQIRAGLGVFLEQVIFESGLGKERMGYLFLPESTDPKAVIVMAHGLGSTGPSSMNSFANEFAKNGYAVFLYSGTGHGDDYGNPLRGIPEGLADLDGAISCVEAREELAGLPVLLMGHSWGGYCVSNAMTFHPEVAGVIACSGFNATADLSMRMDAVPKYLRPLGVYVSLYDWMMFGKYGASTAMKSFACSDCPVMIVHSTDDRTVPYDAGYGLYFDTYGSDSRFTFVEYTNRGHNTISVASMKEYMEFFDACIQGAE